MITKTSQLECQNRGEKTTSPYQFPEPCSCQSLGASTNNAASGRIEAHCQGWKASVWLELFMTAYFV